MVSTLFSILKGIEIIEEGVESILIIETGNFNVRVRRKAKMKIM